eukprot:2239992-Prymnesium_polylepis.1
MLRTLQIQLHIHTQMLVQAMVAAREAMFRAPPARGRALPRDAWGRVLPRDAWGRVPRDAWGRVGTCAAM